MIARYAIAISVGAGVTFALLFIMQLLIATGRGALTEARNFRIVDFVRVERENIVETKKDMPEKPPEPISTVLTASPSVTRPAWTSRPTPTRGLRRRSWNGLSSTAP